MTIPAFKFVDGKLVRLPDRNEFPFVFREYVPKPVEMKYRRKKLTPRMRRFYARKGRPRRQAKRVDAYTTEPVFSKMIIGDEIRWERHTIAGSDPNAHREPWGPYPMRPICYVYLSDRREPDEPVLDAVTRWYFDSRRSSL